jgi:hypothetical protein
MLIMACPKPGTKPGTGPGQACGDKGLYASCRNDLEQEACLAAHGEWGRWGLAPVESCRCPTGDAGCPCDRPGDCEGACITPLDSAAGSCEALTQGACSEVRPVFGCYCFFGEDGRAHAICID